MRNNINLVLTFSVKFLSYYNPTDVNLLLRKVTTKFPFQDYENFTLASFSLNQNVKVISMRIIVQMTTQSPI